MLRAVGKILALALLVTAGSIGYWAYDREFSTAAKVQELEQQKQTLQHIVQRLSGEKRIAEVLVTGQEMVDGQIKTTLLFVEELRGGPAPAPAPKSFTIDGKLVHLDAMVIKFDRDFVGKEDPLRGHSIALFTKFFGEKQEPEKGFTIDEPGQIPEIYRGADPKTSEFEQGLWRDFWRLADDAAYRQEKGVRIANGQGLWWSLEKDRIYTISIESDGGLNYTAEPLKPIVREALKRRVD